MPRPLHTHPRRRHDRTARLRALALFALLATCIASSAIQPRRARAETPESATTRRPALRTMQFDAPDAVLAREGRGWLERRNGYLVLHLNGSPYEVGYQHGVLLRDEIRALAGQVQLADTLYRLVEGKSAIPRLEEAVRRTFRFVSADHKEELRGLADGCGIPLHRVHVLNSIPELFHCSGFAMWGEATGGGELIHGRILDYAMEMGYHHYTVLHCVELDGRIPFVNVGYSGFIGSVTGMNARQVAFGEMGGRGEGLWDGMPMALLMRKGLEEADTLDEAVAIFRDTPRTCEYYYVISDGKGPDARGLACTPDVFTVVEPGKSYERLPHAIRDAVLMSAGSRYELLCERVRAGYGKLDPAAGLELMRRPVAMRSAIHCALFAPESLRLWVAVADVRNTPASERPYTEFSFAELFDDAPRRLAAGE